MSLVTNKHGLHSTLSAAVDSELVYANSTLQGEQQLVYANQYAIESQLVYANSDTSNASDKVESSKSKLSTANGG